MCEGARYGSYTGRGLTSGKFAPDLRLEATSDVGRGPGGIREGRSTLSRFLQNAALGPVYILHQIDENPQNLSSTRPRAQQRCSPRLRYVRYTKQIQLNISNIPPPRLKVRPWSFLWPSSSFSQPESFHLFSAADSKLVRSCSSTSRPTYWYQLKLSPRRCATGDCIL